MVRWAVLPVDLVRALTNYNRIRWLDQGKEPSFVYCAGVYHGLCGGLFYTTVGKFPLATEDILHNRVLISTGYVAASYATEQYRGTYIAATSSFLGLGSTLGSGTYTLDPLP